MGIRRRLSRKHRKLQKARARRKRREEMMKATLRCTGCSFVLVRDEEAGLDIWKCPSCAKTFLRAGPGWITELDTAATPEHEFAVVEFLRKAA